MIHSQCRERPVPLARSFPQFAVLLLLVLYCAGPLSAETLSPLQGVVQLSAGGSHACVLTTSGGVKCWGSNHSGQLGDGSTTNRYLPVPVSGMNSGVIQVSAGASHTCAVRQTGAVQCWGNNSSRQLGDGSTTNRYTPVDVLTLDSGVLEVEAGITHSCAVLANGSARCWGSNSHGQLGTGNNQPQTQPVTVAGVGPLTSIRTGDLRTCALGANGGVACWGVYNIICNQQGCGFQAFLLPTSVSGLSSGVQAISTGSRHTCALSGSAVKCWGSNSDGQLGQPDPNPDPLMLFEIEGLQSGVVSISSGSAHTCATLVNGQARCWGRNSDGMLGDGSSEYRYPPVPVQHAAPIQVTKAGNSFSCALNETGTVSCWGNNHGGQLGNGDPWYRTQPTPVEGLTSEVQQISAGSAHNCAILSGGTMRCWGSNTSGQLGDGTREQRLTPVPVSLPSGTVSGVSAGESHTCAINSSGAASCWGQGENGRLGNGLGVDQLLPVAVSELSSGVTEIHAGARHSCARISTGGSRCWGMNLHGQLGTCNQSDQPTPIVPLNLGHSITAVDTGDFHSCVVRTDGGLRCFGQNTSGQVGIGSTTNECFPTNVPSLNAVSAISLGETHSCSVSGAGAVHCWGANDRGQLAQGYFFGPPQTTPLAVPSLSSGVSAISAGAHHSCVIVSGQLRCWGQNAFGQLGDSTLEDKATPVNVSGLPSAVQQIVVGELHSCALTQTGAVLCWGSHARGQLGFVRQDNRLPGPVMIGDLIFGNGFE